MNALDRRTAAIAGGVAAFAVAMTGVLMLGPGRAGGTTDPGAGPGATSAPATTAPTPTPTRSSEASAPTPLPDIPVQDASLAAQPDAPPEPVHLTLTTLGVDLPVDPVGVEADGQMEIPPHAERAGWYRYGPAPGSDSGAAVIAAHVDSIVSEGLGPFARLQDLEAGDEVEVELADGSTVGYVVDQVVSVPKTDVTWPDVFARDGPGRLVLITCGGRWQPDVRHYANNVIVYLNPVVPDGTA